MDYLEKINNEFPVRKNRGQKEKFRSWAVKEAENLGYSACVEENGFFKHKNVIIGEPEHAAIIFAAHYDTPAAMIVPNLIFPKNMLLFALYQISLVLAILAISLVLPAFLIFFGVSAKVYTLAALCVYIALLVIMVAGKANKHNVNDNTSGVSAIFETMAKVPEDKRKACAFILFDNEEKGKLGSKAYAKNHQQIQYMKLLVNLDCVGNGETMFFAPSKMAQKCSGFGQLLGDLRGENPDRVQVCRQTMINSDQASFKCGVVICACKKSKFTGYYTPRLHTRRDTFADQSNIGFLSDSFAKTISQFK